jgi:FkbM family methyltransferase
MIKKYTKYGIINFLKICALKIFNLKKITLKIRGDFPEIKLEGNSMDYRIYSDIYLYESYNINLKNTPKYIIDCGANVGISTRYFRKIYPESIIIAIEPDLRNFLQLQKNTIGTKIINYRVALHHESTTLRLSDNSLSTYSKRFIDVQNGHEEVHALPLQAIFLESKWPKIDLIKIDIEGAEEALFKNNDPWIKLVNVFVIEFHDYLKCGMAQEILTKIFSNGKYSLKNKGEYTIIERLNWIY